MKILFISLLIVISVNINSCKSKKATSEEETKVETKVESTKSNFIEDGYSKATVIHDVSKNEPCSYLLQLDKGGLLEPQVFANKKFKNNNELVWIKFTRQRRVGRCDNAQPIELTEIIKREK